MNRHHNGKKRHQTRMNHPSQLRFATVERRLPAIMMTPAQLRAARGLLGWSRERLAEASDTYVNTVRNFENGGSDPKRSTLIAWRNALAKAGVELTDETAEHGPGVRLRKG
jgi:ribosome-binding protein aMBF1 (putative translation factor)